MRQAVCSNPTEKAIWRLAWRYELGGGSGLSAPGLRYRLVPALRVVGWNVAHSETRRPVALCYGATVGAGGKPRSWRTVAIAATVALLSAAPASVVAAVGAVGRFASAW